MLKFFGGIAIQRSLLRAGRFQIGDDSDSDFKKVTKKPASASGEITEENVLKVIDEVGAVFNDSGSTTTTSASS